MKVTAVQQHQNIVSILSSMLRHPRSQTDVRKVLRPLVIKLVKGNKTRHNSQVAVSVHV